VTTKADVVDLVEREFRGLEALFSGLTPAQLDVPVYGEGAGWRVRDLVPHVGVWQRRSAEAARRVAAAGELPGGEERLIRILQIARPIDELNAETFATWRDRDLDELFDEFRAGHAELMLALAPLPSHVLVKGDGPEDIYRFVLIPGVWHPRLHREQIDSALKEGAAT